MNLGDRTDYQSRVLVVGASGHGRVLADIIDLSGTDRVIGYIDDGRPEGAWHGDHAVLGSIDRIRHIAQRSRCDSVIVGVGDNAIRATVVERILQAWPEVQFTTAVHPSASIGSGATLGAGSVVMAGAVVGAGSVIGRHCIINTSASLDHDGEMADFASMAPRSVTGGNCKIGTYSVVSIGAVLKHGITVGSDAVIGAGSLVLKDIGDNVIAYGSPALPVRSRSRGERYL